MPDREKVIREKLDEMVELTRGLSYAGFMTAVENANDILALLKEQEAVVRCKDCIHKNGLNHCPHNNDIWVADDWFCADGEEEDAEM